MKYALILALLGLAACASPQDIARQAAAESAAERATHAEFERDVRAAARLCGVEAYIRGFEGLTVYWTADVPTFAVYDPRSCMGRAMQTL